MIESTQSRPAAGIAFLIAGMAAISINDMLIKQLSGGYPLHQLVFARSAIGLVFGLALVQMEGGWTILKTRQPGLHLLRGLLVVLSNMSFFIALAVIPLADATALFFVAPLFITVLSIPILGEKVGPLRIGAVLVGFAGVLVMQRPWAGDADLQVDRMILLLPVFSALTYALMQLMTRKLGAESKASALSIYIQVVFILVSLGFWLVAGDGRFAEGSDNASIVFLLRAWVWPSPEDWGVLIGLGLNSAVIGYCLAQAYRLTDVATVAPFEYALMPMAVFWGWFLWAELPDMAVWIGMTMIVGSGLFVFLREQQKARKIARSAIPSRF
ncbi:DMT family transporter [Sedimentitalea todarodis]|uniref:DMT family transporter n=1 Tax=Sedimentitalea todarodis TaxID=1631240 RepID=A0ABU3V7U9_9RHOB|nr:DMT family transporter [Sedimentitalea todarodis]MDU9002247.1 DMT family transporter [Sedimentitalea todarodis]